MSDNMQQSGEHNTGEDFSTGNFLNKQATQDVLVVGARSKVAEAITRVLTPNPEYRLHFISTNAQTAQISERHFLYSADFTNKRSLKELCMKIRPQFVINCAAMTNVDACETEREQAWRVNVQGVENLVRICKIYDAHLIHFSTDYVFDGSTGPYTEQDLPNPISYYGRTKLAGENAILSEHIAHTILRVNVLYGATRELKQDFVIWLISRFALGAVSKEKPLTIVDDQYSNPTLIDDLGVVVDKILRSRKTGLYHLGGADYLNRFEFAKIIAGVYGFDQSLIVPMKTEALKQPAPRPLRGGLVTLKAQTDFSMQFAGVESGLYAMRRMLQSFGHHEWKL
jgi:dTDP-4-dehydrorhamnose reductase